MVVMMITINEHVPNLRQKNQYNTWGQWDFSLDMGQWWDIYRLSWEHIGILIFYGNHPQSMADCWVQPYLRQDARGFRVGNFLKKGRVGHAPTAGRVEKEICD